MVHFPDGPDHGEEGFIVFGFPCEPVHYHFPLFGWIVREFFLQCVQWFRDLNFNAGSPFFRGNIHEVGAQEGAGLGITDGSQYAAEGVRLWNLAFKKVSHVTGGKSGIFAEIGFFVTGFKPVLECSS